MSYSSQSLWDGPSRTCDGWSRIDPVRCHGQYSSAQRYLGGARGRWQTPSRNDRASQQGWSDEFQAPASLPPSRCRAKPTEIWSSVGSWVWLRGDRWEIATMTTVRSCRCRRQVDWRSSLLRPKRTKPLAGGPAAVASETLLPPCRHRVWSGTARSWPSRLSGSTVPLLPASAHVRQRRLARPRDSLRMVRGVVQQLPLSSMSAQLPCHNEDSR
jgi:hypothetical protein